jgi:hypothetical protein
VNYLVMRSNNDDSYHERPICAAVELSRSTCQLVVGRYRAWQAAERIESAGCVREGAREIAGGGFVGGVGDCAHDRERDAVLVADLGAGRTLHVAGGNGR